MPEEGFSWHDHDIPDHGKARPGSGAGSPSRSCRILCLKLSYQPPKNLTPGIPEPRWM
jgi:hypothetical protein